MTRADPTRPATDLLSDMASGRLSAEALMTAVFDRIEAANPSLNAIVSLRSRDACLAEARAVRPDPAKPLNGLPIAIKDLVETKGLRTTHGSPLFADHVPESDARLARVLRAAGAIIIGKTNTPEFGVGSQTFNSVFGATRNPYDLSRTCGGSSGGAAVAVAAGMLPVADGSDMMGSLRNPAGWNNIYGLRPSAGLVATDIAGASPDLPLGTDGPMARHPQDLALLLNVLAQPEADWPHRVSLRAASPGLAGRRIGWLSDLGGRLPMEPGILDLCRAALSDMERAGAVVGELRPPFAPEAAWMSWTRLRAAHIAEAQANADPAGLKDTVRWEVAFGQSLSPAELDTARQARVDVTAALDAAFEEVDFLCLPSAQVWPFPHEIPFPQQIASRSMDTYHRWMEVMVPASLTGRPAVSIPVGFSDDGLPMGLQIIGPAGSDHDLIALAQAWHGLTGWPGRRPPDVTLS